MTYNGHPLDPSVNRPLIVRSRVALLAAALLAVLAGGCTPSGIDASTAAVVNDSEIPVGEVRRLFEVAVSQPQLEQQLESDDSDQLELQIQAQVLTQLVTTTLLEQGAAELGIEATPEDIRRRREEIVRELGGEEAFRRVVRQSGFTAAQVRDQLRAAVLQERVEQRLQASSTVTEAEVREFYRANRAERYVRVSARHILVRTRAAAQRVLDRLGRGASFAALAREVSVDEQTARQGGDLGRITPGQTVPAFEEAALGAAEDEVVGPVRTQFGFHIIQVTERQADSLAEVRAEIRSELEQTERQTAVSDWLVRQAREAQVTVNPRFGRWDPESAQVVAESPVPRAEQPDGTAPQSSGS
ncbi:MAG: peptidylprolyl isomerase [Actinomycetota bacterium]|nr:peptidylprolyl isomerase [Actinomycetota bacterium]